MNNILRSSRSSVKKFTLFVLLTSLLSLILRATFIYFLSPVGLSTYTVKALVIIICVSSSLSIAFFYLRFYYSTKIKQFFSRFVNFEEIDDNNLRWTHLEDEARKQFPEINFNVKFLIIPLVFWFILIVKLKESNNLNNTFSVTFIICSIIYFLYLQIIRGAILATQIAPDMEPKPPRVLKLWWHFTYTIWESLQEILFGRSSAPKTLTNEELKYQILKNRNRYWRFGLATAVCGSLIGSEMWLYGDSAILPPTSRLKNLILSGYYSSQRDVMVMAWELDRRGCNMESFCFPNTKKLDEKAIQEAYDYVQDARNGGKKLGVDLPLPMGCYSHIINGIGEPDKSPFMKIELQSENKATISSKEDSSIV